jgi:hypothetical protein
VLGGAGEMAKRCGVEDDGAGGERLRGKCSLEKVFWIFVSMVLA